METTTPQRKLFRQAGTDSAGLSFTTLAEGQPYESGIPSLTSLNDIHLGNWQPHGAQPGLAVFSYITHKGESVATEDEAERWLVEQAIVGARALADRLSAACHSGKAGV